MRITVLAGGVGAARFLEGLCRAADPADITAICNVGDDFEWHGLHVSPDIDTVIYTLAGLEGELGWGVHGDTLAALGELAELGEEPWFQIGDRDLATHVWRTERLRAGRPLSEVTADLARLRGLALALHPATDDPHPTVVVTPDGPLDFQDYFVRGRASAEVVGVEFPGAASAMVPAPGVLDAVATPDMVIVAPSNPFVSIEPILVVPGVREALRDTSAPVVAVSPIVGGEAVKGPAAAMMQSLGHEVSALGVARLYAGLVDVFVLDEVDRALAPAVGDLGMRAVVTDTMMTSADRRLALASTVLDAAGGR
ncbi:MAG: 2-phospho-L-lactate transferase [Chloroflexi bacterium]|nr:2-phospho-L-lactate transferase [Chloroflexota bacterium]